MSDKLNWKGLATSFGIFWGVYVGASAGFASANIRMPWFGPGSFNMLMDMYPWLTPTTSGILVGLLWGAACGAICGAIIAWLYNWASAKCGK